MLSERKEFDKYLVMEKYFILMPLMHSENPKYTRMCVTEFMNLDKEVQTKMPKIYQNGLSKMLQTGIKYS